MLAPLRIDPRNPRPWPQTGVVWRNRREWTVLRESYGLKAMAPGRGGGPVGPYARRHRQARGSPVRKDLLTRRGHPSDGRTQSIMLTADGETRVARFAAIADPHDAEIFATLSKDDRQAPERRLRGLVEQRGLRPMAGLL